MNAGRNGAYTRRGGLAEAEERLVTCNRRGHGRLEPRRRHWKGRRLEATVVEPGRSWLRPRQAARLKGDILAPGCLLKSQPGGGS